MRISDWSSDVCSSDVCSSDLKGMMLHCGAHRIANFAAMASAAGTGGFIGHRSLLGIRREHIINMLDGNSLFQVSIALHPSAPAGGIHSDGSPAPYLETTICSIANPFFSAASKLVFSFGEGSQI